MGVEIIPVRKSEKLTGGLGGARWGGERGGVALYFQELALCHLDPSP